MVSFFFQLSVLQRLVFFLILKALLIVAIILYAGIGLGPDEAQYWTWSQALDWGYYSKPPGIAWQIWLGTQVFGQTEWGVRSVTVILAVFQSLAIYQLALYTGLSLQTAFWCGLLMAFCPLGMTGSLFAITDVGFLLCWTGACLSVVSALHHKKEPNPLHIGGWIIGGALFKWPIYLFWIFILCCHRLIFPTQKKTSILVGILLSLLGLLPSIWWNWSHDWATFLHIFATLKGGSGHQAAGNIGEFLVSQSLLLSPVLFILLLCGLWQWFYQRQQLTPQLFFCGFVTILSLICLTLVSCFQKIQGNWMIFAYPTGLIILCWFTFEQKPHWAWWTKFGVGLSILIIFLLILLPSSYRVHSFIPHMLNYQFNPFKHNLGWVDLRHALEKQGYDPNQHFLFSDKYQTTSILSFYGPGQKRAYFFNLRGIRRNQFSYWPSLQKERARQAGYFVWIENAPYLEHRWQLEYSFYQRELQRYFEKVDFLGLSPLVYEDLSIVKAALIFRCQNYKNLSPSSSFLY